MFDIAKNRNFWFLIIESITERECEISSSSFVEKSATFEYGKRSMMPPYRYLEEMDSSQGALLVNCTNQFGMRQ